MALYRASVAFLSQRFMQRWGKQIIHLTAKPYNKKRREKRINDGDFSRTVCVDKQTTYLRKEV